MQEDTSNDEKEEILEELGFAKDYELSDELTAAIKTTNNALSVILNPFNILNSLSIISLHIFII